MASASKFGFSLSLDSAYGRINLLDGLKVASAIDVAVTGGRFALILPAASSAPAPRTTTKSPGTESALNMIKISNDLNFGLEAVISFQEIEQMIGTEYSS